MAENIHDKFFKENFSRQDIAVAFVEQLFPEALVSQLRLETFDLAPVSYVEPPLDEYFADIIYTCQLREGSQPVKIALLFEHKSYREKYPHFQLLRYLLNSWDQATKQDEPLTMLIPVVIYHGKSRWQYESLASYFGPINPGLAEYLPEFRYLLYDISHLPDEQLLSFQNRFLATSLFLMKHREHEQALLANRQTLFRWLNDVLDTERGRNYLTTTVVYLSKNLDLRPKSFFTDLFVSLNNPTTTMSTYDQIVEEGIIKGLARGRQEGRQEGRREEREDAFRSMLQFLQQQEIDITSFASQYTELPAERVQAIIDEVKRQR